MASRQGAVKHGFVSKIAGGCTSYGLPHKVPQNPAARSAAVFSLPAKNLRGRGVHQPPCPGEG